MRLAALIDHKLRDMADAPTLFNGFREQNLDRLPFMWSDSCPSLLGEDEANPMPQLFATVQAAHTNFMKEFGLPLGMIWIDTCLRPADFPMRTTTPKPRVC